MLNRPMQLFPLGTLLSCLILCAAGSLSASPARAQDSPPSVSELRRENEQLRIRIDELEAQLVKSQEAIARLLEQVRELNDQIAQLRRDLQERPQTAPDGNGAAPEPTPPTDDTQAYATLPSDSPFAAPEALFAEVKESYESIFADIETPFSSSEERARYLRDVEAWSKSQRRSLRSQIEWTIQVRRMFNGDREPLTIEYRAVDPQTRLPYSDRRFTLQLPSRFERRVLDESETEFWQVRGIAGAAVTINRERESIGFFDVRPFVGPFVEFGIDLSLTSILPAPEPVIADPNDAASDPSPDSDPDADADTGR